MVEEVEDHQRNILNSVPVQPRKTEWGSKEHVTWKIDHFKTASAQVARLGQ